MGRTPLFWDGPMCNGADRTRYSEQKGVPSISQELSTPKALQVLKLLDPQDESIAFLQNGRIC
jgi:hypothetical protein